MQRKADDISNNTNFIFLSLKMLSHYISDIYVSFRNTRYNTSSILNVMFMIDYKCKTLSKQRILLLLLLLTILHFLGIVMKVLSHRTLKYHCRGPQSSAMRTVFNCFTYNFNFLSLLLYLFISLFPTL